MKTKPVLVVIVVLVVAILACNVPTTPTATAPSVTQAPPTPAPLTPPPDVRGPGFAAYPEIAVALPESYQGYALPVALETLGNYDKFVFSDAQSALVMQNGFVVAPAQWLEFFQVYENARYSEIPVFVTTDSVYHVYHLIFDKMLRDLEHEHFEPDIRALTAACLRSAQALYTESQGAELENVARSVVAYFAVADALINPDAVTPPEVADLVQAELALIEAHAGMGGSPIFSQDCPEGCDPCDTAPPPECLDQPCLCEDYSQYVPRGHYTASEGLKRYFKAMMWLGRMTYKARGEGWTKSALLLTDAVKAAGVIDMWMTIYTVTGFFAGASDDLTFYDYDTAVAELFGYGFDEDEKLSGDIAADLQKKIAKRRGPKILGGFEFDLGGELKDATQGLRLIGQRYAVDSHVLSEMVYSNVGPNPEAPKYDQVLNCKETRQEFSQPVEFYKSCKNMEKDRLRYFNEVCARAIAMQAYGRCGGLEAEELYTVCRLMPSGLDVMSALGSKTADEIMAARKMSTFCDYSQKMKKMKKLVAGYDQKKWTENLYNAWLWMIQPVLGEKTAGYPNWMRTELWRKKELITALASWAQLRHDTILYVKQSYTRAIMITADAAAPRPMESKYYGYVEPNPELYARAGFLVEYLQKGLEEQKVMTPAVKKALAASREMMDRLQSISEKELLGEALSEEDYDYIERINKVFESIISDLAAALKVEGQKPDGPVETHTSLEGKDDAFKTTIVADVHTEANTEKVLEVGSGYIDWVIIAHESKDGRVGLAVGPIFSYYEFPHPMSDRLTDKKWRKLLSTEPPARPDWVLEFME